MSNFDPGGKNNPKTMKLNAYHALGIRKVFYITLLIINLLVSLQVLNKQKIRVNIFEKRLNCELIGKFCFDLK